METVEVSEEMVVETTTVGLKPPSKREVEGDAENGHHRKKAKHAGLEGLHDILSRTRLAQLEKKKQDILMLEHNCSIGHALRELAKHRVLSAPVVIAAGLEDILDDPSGKPTPEQLIGWLDIKDILHALVTHLEETVPPEEGLPTKMLALMTLLDREGPHFTDKMLITITGGADKQLVYKANDNASLLDTIRDQFLQPPDSEGKQQVVHRLAIFDTEGAITSIISQLDVMKFLLENAGEMEDVASTSLSDLGLLTGKPPLETVDPNLPTFLALRRILEEGLSGAAVVHPTTKELIANLSISDLRAIQPEHLSILALPVAEFLALTHNTTYIGYSASKSESASHPFFAQSKNGADIPVGDGNGDVRMVTCTASATLKEVLALLVENKIHRVYVVEDTVPPVPAAVITCTDIMRVVSGVW